MADQPMNAGMEENLPKPKCPSCGSTYVTLVSGGPETPFWTLGDRTMPQTRRRVYTCGCGVSFSESVKASDE